MISVLMSSKNPRYEYLKDCMNSIFNQSYKDFELVLIDDGSDIPISNWLQDNDYDMKKIIIIRLDKSVGLPTALNIGLDYCKGEFIARIDDDDIMFPSRLEDNLNFVVDNNLDGCWSWFQQIDEEGNNLELSKITVPKSKLLHHLLIKGNFLCHSSLFVKKSVLKCVNGYDQNLRFAQDNDLNIRLLSNYEFDVINKPLIYYRINGHRNNIYKETLSLNNALFGVANYYTNKKKFTIKEKFIFFVRLLYFYFGIIKISKKK